MKELILLALFGLTPVPGLERCCDDNALMKPRGYCAGSSKRINRNCTNGHFLLKDIIINGTMLTTQDSPNFVIVQDPNDYCVGEMYVNESDRTLGIIPAAVVCFQPPPSNPTPDSLKLTVILLLMSVVFLVLTLVVYMILPKLRDLQGLCYMNMCVSMAIGLLSLSILQFTPGYIGQNACAFAGFTLYFWMIATFFWMNVVSINVYRTVTNASHSKMTERNQFGIYSCYAWGSSVVLLFVALVTNYMEGGHYKPGIGLNNMCWFRGTAETFIFFYGPIGILIAVNIALFVSSSIQLWMDHKKYETSTLNNLRYRFLLSLKLFLVMGISWIFEIISFVHGEPHIIWKIMDTFNCLQGLVIFLLLVVLRKRAMMGLAEEGCCRGITGCIANRLSPHDDSDDKQMLTDEHTEEMNKFVLVQH